MNNPEKQLQGGMDRAINFVLMARFNKTVSQATLHDALNRIQGRHYALEYGNKRDAKQKSHPRIAAISVTEIMNCSENSWQGIAAKEMAIPFPADGPFVRVSLLQENQKSDFVLAFDHQVCDGMSGVLFIRDLAYLLNHTDERLPDLPVHPPVWEIMPDKAANDWMGKMRIALFMKFADFSAWQNRNKPVSVFEPSFRVDAFEFDQPKSKALVERCRWEETSVHAAVSAAWMLALQSAFNESGEVGNALRSVSSPVSLRYLLPEDKRDSAGMYYSTVTTSIDCNHSRDFWEIARQAKHQMALEIEKSSFYDKPRFFEAMYERQSKLADGEVFKVPQIPVDYDFSISNLGRLDSFLDCANANLEYQIDAVYGPVVNAFKGEKTVGVCTLNGKIRFVFTSFVGDMEEAFIKNLLEKVQTWLKIAIDDGIS